VTHGPSHARRGDVVWWLVFVGCAESLLWVTSTSVVITAIVCALVARGAIRREQRLEAGERRPGHSLRVRLATASIVAVVVLGVALDAGRAHTEITMGYPPPYPRGDDPPEECLAIVELAGHVDLHLARTGHLPERLADLALDTSRVDLRGLLDHVVLEIDGARYRLRSTVHPNITLIRGPLDWSEFLAGPDGDACMIVSLVAALLGGLTVVGAASARGRTSSAMGLVASALALLVVTAILGSIMVAMSYPSGH